MTTLSTADLLARASAALLDPEQTAAAPAVADALAALLRSLSPLQNTAATGRAAAVAVLDHEHTRQTAEPKIEPSDTADVIDRIATSFAHGAVDGVDDESADAAFHWLINLRDDVRAGRVL